MARGEGIQFLIHRSNRNTVARNFYAKNPKIVLAIRDISVAYGEKIFQKAYDLAPKDTFFMVNRLRLDFTENGLNFTIGYYASDFERDGRDFYAPHQELGTRHSAAQPHLGPAFRMYNARFKKAVGTALRKAAKQR